MSGSAARPPAEVRGPSGASGAPSCGAAGGVASGRAPLRVTPPLRIQRLTARQSHHTTRQSSEAEKVRASEAKAAGLYRSGEAPRTEGRPVSVSGSRRRFQSLRMPVIGRWASTTAAEITERNLAPKNTFDAIVVGAHRGAGAKGVQRAR